MFKKKKYTLDGKQLIKLYEQMLLIRRFEEKCGQLYGMGEIGGFCHLYIGQEAVIAGIDAAKSKNDSTVTSYRDHGHIIASGIDPKFVMAELTGRATGCSKGKGGSMHMFNKEGKFFGGHGIVGAQVPIGTGIAFAEKYNKTKNICITFMGDGAVNQGQVFEAFNMAALWKLPVLYVIENNEYSMGTSVKRSTAMTELHRKGESFGIEGVQVNGMDPEEIYDVTKQALDYIRKNHKPFIIEAKTYRYRGHSMSDPAKYRTKSEVEKYKQQDVIAIMKEKLLKKAYITEEKLKKISQKIKQQIDEVEEFALKSELPDEKELYTDIFK